jgi:hypothetical protein
MLPRILNSPFLYPLHNLDCENKINRSIAAILGRTWNLKKEFRPNLSPDPNEESELVIPDE